MRLVLINNVTKTVTVYENKTPLASYEMQEIPFSKEDIEEIRTLDYKDKA